MPNQSHLQVFVLSCIKKGPQLGEEIRASMEKVGTKLSLASFYQLMRRIEQAKYVKGKYIAQTIDGHGKRKRGYSITAAGKKALEQTLSFYRQLN